MYSASPAHNASSVLRFYFSQSRGTSVPSSGGWRRGWASRIPRGGQSSWPGVNGWFQTSVFVFKLMAPQKPQEGKVVATGPVVLVDSVRGLRWCSLSSQFFFHPAILPRTSLSSGPPG